MNLDYKSKYLKYKKKYLNLKLEGGAGVINDNTRINKPTWTGGVAPGPLCGEPSNNYQCTLPFKTKTKTKNNEWLLFPGTDKQTLVEAIPELMFPGPEEKTYVDAIFDTGENAHTHFGLLYQIALEKYLLHISNVNVAWSKVKLNIPKKISFKKEILSKVKNYKELIVEFIKCLAWLNKNNKFDFLFEQDDIKEKRKMMQKGMMFTYPPNESILKELGLDTYQIFVPNADFADDWAEDGKGNIRRMYLGQAIYEDKQTNLVDVFSKELLKYDFEKAIILYANTNTTIW